MEKSDRIDLASELLNNLYERIFDDESRILSILNLKTKSVDALIDELGTSIRYIALSALKDRLSLGSLDPGISSLIDNIEAKSVKRMREMTHKYITKNEIPMSALLRPGIKH